MAEGLQSPHCSGSTNAKQTPRKCKSTIQEATWPDYGGHGEGAKRC